MANLFDTHAHLQSSRFNHDLSAVISRAQQATVIHILNLGTNPTDSKEVVEIARRYPGCLAAVGIHPSDIDTWSEKATDELVKLAALPEVVAWGEIGLDYYHKPYDEKRQRAGFRYQLGTARELSLPVSMHCREAYADLLADLRTERGEEIRGIAHCFSGTLEDAKALVDMGFHLGVGGTVTFPDNADLRATLAKIGIEHLVLETDSPYLAPKHRRGRRNEPAYIEFAAMALGDLFGLGFSEIKEATYRNAVAALRIPHAQLVSAERARILIDEADS